MEARNKRAVAEAAERQAKAKAAAEAAEAARIARIKWEIDNGEEARKRYYAEALAKAKEEDHRGTFDLAEFDASYGAGEGGYVGFDNPEHEFFERWRKEHHTIWPDHLEAEPDHSSLSEVYKQKRRRMERLMAAVNLDHITDMKKARKLFDAADELSDAAVEKDLQAMCALADFEARENKERWGDLKDQWIADWEADNWDDE
jgi:hypothetical protein